MSEQRVKKQHYVPRCYLERWTIQGKYQTHVYDKELNKARISSINDIASENYFYDINYSEILRDEDFEKIGISREVFKEFDFGQGIEKFFGQKIEDDYANILKKIQKKIDGMTSDMELLRDVITVEEKISLSYYLALQIVRTKFTRNAIRDSADCLTQILMDMKIPEKHIDKYRVSKEELKYIHSKMIFDKKRMGEICKSLFDFVWIFLVNRTEQLFYTSDNPIGTEAHVEDQFFPMNGLNSPGVEAFFPLSPRVMLVMLDRKYHRKARRWERKAKVFNDSLIVNGYNARCVVNAERCVFSSEGDFSVIEKMLEMHPNVLEQPHSVMEWGGKTYVPKK